MICNKCGFSNVNEATFCMECGASLSPNAQASNQQPNSQSQYAPQYQQAPQPQNQYAQPIQPQTVYTQIRPQNTEFSAWAWLGIDILSWIPFINIILWIVWACGGTDRMSLRNYSKGKLLLILVAIALIIIGIIIVLILGGSLAALFSPGYY